MTYLKIFILGVILFAFFVGYQVGITQCENKKPVNTTVVNTTKPATDSIWSAKTTTKIVYIKSDNETRRFWYYRGALACQYESPYANGDKDLRLKIYKHFQMDSALIP